MSDAASIRASYLLKSHEVVAELLALAVVEHSHTDDVAIGIRIAGHSGWIADTGRGMRLSPDTNDTLSHAERALTTIYPVRAASDVVQAALERLVWGSRGSLGPALPNAWCESLAFTSHRDGAAWSQAFRRGSPTGPPQYEGPTEKTGTTMRFTVATPIDAAVVAGLVRDLLRCIPTLDLTIVPEP